MGATGRIGGGSGGSAISGRSSGEVAGAGAACEHATRVERAKKARRRIEIVASSILVRAGPIRYAGRMAESLAPIRTFEDFLTTSVHRIWERGDSRPSEFLAVLLAVPEAWQVAWDETTKDGYGKLAVASALSVATVTTLLRLIASGPLGLLLTGLSVGTLATIYASEQAKIVERTRVIGEVVERFRVEFGELVAERDRKPMRESQWTVMMDGFLARFLGEVASPGAVDPASIAGFAEHVVGPSMPPGAGKTLGSR